MLKISTINSKICQQEDASDTGDLLDDDDIEMDLDELVDELELAQCPPDIILSTTFSFQRFAKFCILIIAKTVAIATL